ncbi:MAG: acetyl-CoA carboxylase biotin carboxyl carrier protein [Thermoanaerobaculales bacterium]|jgi:acetyl-CoA carboxylase biotin carboxyl carrier protein|nr:acetyl-CoA carboxylase biotin carboxyl carrier protein [Thermoanaerobaculales bacterium]
MFKFDELCELIRLVGSSGVAAVEIEHAGGRLRIDGVPKVAAAVPTAPPAAGAVPTVDTAAPMAAAPEPVDETTDDDEGLIYVTSPIVGTFYRAPNPDAEPYVMVGDAVDTGRTLCIVEAMKLMNEIESDTSGTIVKVFPENAQPVEFGERLFAIRPS